MEVWTGARRGKQLDIFGKYTICTAYPSQQVPENKTIRLHLFFGTFWLNWICIYFSCRDNWSFRLHSLGPLCLWQCLSWYILQPESHQLSLQKVSQTPGPIDRTPGTPGSHGLYSPMNHHPAVIRINNALCIIFPSFSTPTTSKWWNTFISFITKIHNIIEN